jgi:hypothetical protein
MLEFFFEFFQTKNFDLHAEQAVHKDFANGVIKATHSLRSHKLGICGALPYCAGSW